MSPAGGGKPGSARPGEVWVGWYAPFDGQAGSPDAGPGGTASPWTGTGMVDVASYSRSPVRCSCPQPTQKRESGLSSRPH